MKPASQYFKLFACLVTGILSFNVFAQVGVNTTSPLAQLHVVEDGDANPSIFTELTATNSNWSALEGANPNTAGGTGIFGTGYFGVYGQGLAGVYGYGNFGTYGEAADPVADWAGYYIGDLGVEGDIYYTGALVSVSDRRVKSNIREFTGAITIIEKLNPVIYDKSVESSDLNLNIEAKTPVLTTGKRTAVTKENEYGLIAQEVETIIPQLVSEKPVNLKDKSITSLKGVDYLGLIPLMVKALQEQQSIIRDLERRIHDLENR